MDELLHRAADHLVRLVTELSAGRRNVLNDGPDVRADDHVHGLVGQLSIARFALGQGLLGGLAGADIAQPGDDLGRSPVGAQHHLGAALHPHPRAPRGLDALLPVSPLVDRGAGEQGGHQLADLGDVVGVDQLIAGATDQIRRLVAETAAGWRDVENPVPGVDAHDDVGRIVGQHLKVVGPGGQGGLELAAAFDGGGDREAGRRAGQQEDLQHQGVGFDLAWRQGAGALAKH